MAIWETPKRYWRRHWSVRPSTTTNQPATGMSVILDWWAVVVIINIIAPPQSRTTTFEISRSVISVFHPSVQLSIHPPNRRSRCQQVLLPILPLLPINVHDLVHPCSVFYPTPSHIHRCNKRLAAFFGPERPETHAIKKSSSTLCKCSEKCRLLELARD